LKNPKKKRKKISAKKKNPTRRVEQKNSDLEMKFRKTPIWHFVILRLSTGYPQVYPQAVDNPKVIHSPVDNHTLWM
jgi:hypothetical protein